MIPFLAEGLEAGEKVFQILDKEQRDQRRSRLAQAGIDVAAAEERGLLELRPWEETYLKGRRFDQHAMLDILEGIAKEGEKQTGATRLWANMEWALLDYP